MCGCSNFKGRAGLFAPLSLSRGTLKFKSSHSRPSVRLSVYLSVSPSSQDYASSVGSAAPGSWFCEGGRGRGGRFSLSQEKALRPLHMPMMEAMPNFVEGVHHCIALLGALSSFLPSFFLPCPFLPFPFFGRMSIQPRARAGRREGGREAAFVLWASYSVRASERRAEAAGGERGREDRGPTDRRDHGRLMSANGTAPPLAEAASKKGCPTCAAERKDEIFNI